ncbi:hypothetical protein LX16_2556 [Stackebrandtia albiflava]|uniref:DUF8083 domain-containing protein n=1 Tax=Stackebrandtia albiflava TaxID=406432 RepID=A0A562V1N5_9ACTN|nr:hypothetical protein [Stackebrandtia albiflava]TWJ11819.1 hypothetical protein LX16_2556 [Stackebrandtia albiflava]
MTVPTAAYLRVYEPLAAFSAERASWWRRYAAEGRGVPVELGPVRQRRSLYESGGLATRLPQVPDEAYVLDGDDGPLICPWQLHPRMAASVRGLADGVASLRLATAFVAPEVAAEAAATGDGPDARHRPDGTAVYHEHIATWHLPSRWFVCVEAAERELVVTEERRTCRYRVPMARARHRAHRAHEVLRASLGADNPVTRAVRELSEWLAVFHPRSVVEVDYGGLVWVLSAAELRADVSPRLVHEGLLALARGDVVTAGRHYEQLMRQWRRIRVRERSN